jgi:NAD(P)-dependent dehydrogenase (short-subunit alcohol dehydrogenase family)
VWTPFVTNDVAGDRDLRRLREDRRLGNLLRTEGTAWDTAYAVLFLASDESRWTTGQTVIVDGGMTSSYRKGPRSAAAADATTALGSESTLPTTAAPP